MSYAAWSVIAGETPTATKWNILGSNDADFDTRVSQLLDDKTLETVAYASSITFNLANGKFWRTVLTGNPTLAISNLEVGVPFGILLEQGTGGSHTISSWFDYIEWPSASEPPLSTAEGESDLFIFTPVSATQIIGSFGGFGHKAAA